MGRGMDGSAAMLVRGAGAALLGALVMLGAGARAGAEDAPERGAAPAAAPAPRGDVVVYDQPAPLGELLAEVARRQPGLVGYHPDDKQLQRRLPPGRYRVSGPDLVPALRRLLVPFDVVLVPQGAPPHLTWWALDARQQGVIVGLRAETIELSDATLARYEGEEGLFVSALIAARGLENLRDARNALQRLLSPNNIGLVVEVPDAGAFIVTDFAPRVCAVFRLVRQLEASSTRGVGGAQSRMLQVQHGQATDLAALLGQALLPPPAAPAAGPQAAGASVPGTLRIVADARTNQLLLRGTAAELDEVARLAAALDVPLAPPVPVEAHVLPLRRARADRLATLLQSVTNASGGLWLQGAGRAPRPVFVGDERTNALVVTASASAIGAIRALVQQLDTDSDGPAGR